MKIHGCNGMLAAAVLVLTSTAMAGGPGASPQSAVDVALDAGGVLRGRLVDPNGIPLAARPVSVFYEGRVIAQSVTDDQGDFSVLGLRGGSHALATADHSLICRLWTAKAAPPLAQKSVLIVSPDMAVRGQSCQRCVEPRHKSPCFCDERPYLFGSCKPTCDGKCHYLLQPRALILYAGLGAVIWQASDRSLSSPSL